MGLSVPLLLAEPDCYEGKLPCGRVKSRKNIPSPDFPVPSWKCPSNVYSNTPGGSGGKGIPQNQTERGLASQIPGHVLLPWTPGVVGDAKDALPKPPTLNSHLAQTHLWKQLPCQAENCSRTSPRSTHGSISSAATTLQHNPKLPFCSFILVSTPVSTAQITLNVRLFPRLSHVTLETGTASPARLLRAGAVTRRCHQAK